MPARTMRPSPLLLALTLSVFAPTMAAAQAEFETDPIAYALNGFSLHAAKVLGATRLNVGVFGADIPRAYHGNDGWNARMRGAGVKWDYIGSTLDGFFVGADGGYMRTIYTLRSDGQRVGRDVIGIGLRGGYRMSIGNRGLYVSPWVGVSHNFSGDDVVIGAEKFDRGAVSVFPTVHIGWRF